MQRLFPDTRQRRLAEANSAVACRNLFIREDAQRRLGVNPERARLSGDTLLRMSDFRLKKISALAGTITLKEELKFSFDLVAE